MEKIFIKVQNNKVEVTNLEKGLEQARNFVGMHEKCKKQKKQGMNVFYFKDAHAYWISVLEELENLQKLMVPDLATTV